MILYRRNKDKEETQIKKVRIATMTDEQKQETKRLIEEAERCLKDGRTIRECENKRLKNMMRKIAANAVLIDLCDLNHIIVSNICDGDFESVQPFIEEIIERLATCLAIMKAKGDNLVEVISDEELDNAIEYTIYEQIDERVFRDE